MLSFKGFMQLYQLQTENEEKETWKDLVNFALRANDSCADLSAGKHMASINAGSRETLIWKKRVEICHCIDLLIAHLGDTLYLFKQVFSGLIKLCISIKNSNQKARCLCTFSTTERVKSCTDHCLLICFKLPEFNAFPI